VWYLELVLEDVFLCGHLAIEAQQALLLWAKGLVVVSWRIACLDSKSAHVDVHFVLLMGIHDGLKKGGWG
jgi:hypothetical protein